MQDLRFFVVHLNDEEATQLGGAIEVQLLKRDGRAKAVAYANEGCEALKVGDCEVGRDLLAKAESLPVGQGIYVDIAGNELVPF